MSFYRSESGGTPCHSLWVFVRCFQMDPYAFCNNKQRYSISIIGEVPEHLHTVFTREAFWM